MSQQPKARITSVDCASPGAVAGLEPGDILLTLDGQPVRDQIDYRFLSACEHLHLDIARGEQRLSVAIDKEFDEEVGLGFAEATFDGVRRCRNRCLFCFVDRMRPGLRPTLYVKDDDYRYSFLFGNYVTLSNLREEDWRRLETQRLSPLHVSVHATDRQLRRRLLGNPQAPDILEQLRRLAGLHIAVQAQVVLCPGLNDGEQLRHTVFDLAELAESVLSVAVVPVGITRYGPRNDIRSHTPEEMAAVVDQVAAWQRQLRRRLGRSFVHLADEFYLRTGRSLPSRRQYDGFSQYENGVGMARVLLDEWGRTRRHLRSVAASGRQLSLVCGELVAPYLTTIAGELQQATGVQVDLHVIRNHFFGSAITVSGLLTASDVVSSLQGKQLGDLLVLPRAMFDADGRRTLDEAEVSDIEKALGVQVTLAGSTREISRLLARLADTAAG
ncbi:MAG: DUF512 domain-containing protein [Chloroflexi bacterium]|nr:DUF512 domain-containing protein [Chloroflexota bacterium]